MLLSNAFILVLGIVMIVQINQGLQHLGLLFDISMVLALGCHVVGFMLSVTILAKLTNEESRGSMFALNSVFGSIFILVMQYFGGYLFDKVTNSGPLYICALFYILSVAANVMLWVGQKLKV